MPTASGDADHYVVRFYRAFAASGCEPSHVSLFRRDRGAGAVEGDLAAHLLAQDLIYVGGGSVLSPARRLARARPRHRRCAEAWRRGMVLCGLSAGSLCWFAEAVTAFHGAPTRVEGLGLLPHSNCVHYDGEPERRAEYRRFVGDGMRAGYAAEDGVGAALRRRATCTASSPRAPAARVPRRRPRGRDRGGGAAAGRRARRDGGAARAGRRRMTAPTVLALGGGGFTSDEGDAALDDLVLELCGVPVPRILFLPTAAGTRRCRSGASTRPSATAPASPTSSRSSAWPASAGRCEEIVLGQDVDLRRRRLAAQPAGGLARARPRRPPARGVGAGHVLAGLSAGAMCWFEGGVTTSGGLPAPAPALGLLPGSLSVHADGEPARRPVYLDAVRRGALPPGWLLDDGAGLVFRGRRLERVVTARPDAGAAVVDVDGVVPLRAELLRRPPTPLPAVAASEDVRELRALRQALAARP